VRVETHRDTMSSVPNPDMEVRSGGRVHNAFQLPFH